MTKVRPAEYRILFPAKTPGMWMLRMACGEHVRQVSNGLKNRGEYGEQLVRATPQSGVVCQICQEFGDPTLTSTAS